MSVMIVVCYVEGCPYNSVNHFCMRRVLPIIADGRCGHVYRKNGSVNPHWQEKMIEEGEKKDDDSND
jgi:hypothetical protein